MLPYLFGYKMEDFPFQSNTINLDPSNKMDVDFWTFLQDKTYLIAELHTMDLHIWGTSEKFKKGSCQLLAKVCARSTG